MPYRFKVRKSDGAAFYVLDVCDAETGTRCYSLDLPDRPYSEGWSVHSYFGLSPDETFLEVCSVLRFLGDNDYTVTLYRLDSGKVFYTADYEAQFSFSPDGRYVYRLRSEFYYSRNPETLVLEAGTGSELETRVGDDALFKTGLPVRWIEVQREES